MKKGKLILASLAFVVALGSAFAFKAQQKFASPNIYFFNGSTYTQETGCYYPQETSTACTTLTTTTGYYYLTTSGYEHLPSGPLDLFEPIN